MCVRVLLADDAAVVRKAIRNLLSGREDIALVGEASDFREIIPKAAELHPDLIILDVNMARKGRISPAEVRNSLDGKKVLAITFGIEDTDEELRELLNSVGAVKVLDKINLSEQLIPAILEQERVAL